MNPDASSVKGRGRPTQHVPWRCSVCPQRESTAAQFALLWTWVNAIASQSGDKPDDVYKFICHHMLPHGVTVMGEAAMVYGSPKELGKAEMTAFLDRVRIWVRERWGINLPQPGDRVFEQFKAKYG